MSRKSGSDMTGFGNVPETQKGTPWDGIPPANGTNGITEKGRFVISIALVATFSLVIPITGFLLLRVFLGGWRMPHELIHAAFEIAGALIALFMAMIFLINSQAKDYHRRAWIASALIAIGIFDIHHACVNPGVAFVWLHNLSIIAGGLMFGVLFLFPGTIVRLGAMRALPFAVMVTSFTASWLSLAFSEYLPAMATESGFTPMAQTMNIAGGVFFLIAGAGFAAGYRTRSDDTRREYLLFAGFCFLFGASGLVFPISSLWEADWWLFHLFRVIAYLLLVGNVVILLVRGRELDIAYQPLHSANQQLRAAEQQLRASNQQLRATEQQLRASNQQLGASNQQLRATEKTLRESEAKNRAIVKSIPQMLFLKDRDSVYLMVNERYANSVGMRPDEFQGCNDLSIYPSELAEKYRADDRAVIQTGEAKIIEEPYIAQGKEYWVRTIKAPVRNEDGEVFALLGLFEDITGRREMEAEQRRLVEQVKRDRRALVSTLEDQRRTEEALLESEEKYRFLYDSNPMPMSIFETGTLKFLSVNDAFVNKYGYTREELLNMSILEIRPESEREKTILSVEAIDTGITKAGIFNHKKKNGEIIQVEIIRLDIKFDGKNAKLVLVNDVTERLQAEKALQESERRLRHVLDGLGPHMFAGLLDLQGRVLLANRPALEAAALRPEEVRGKPVESTYWFTWSEAVSLRLSAAVERAAQGESVRYDEQIRVAEGQLIWFDFSIQPLRDETGSIRFLVPSGLVISERKQAEEALRKSEAIYKTLVANIPQKIFMKDRNFRWLSINENFARDLGIRPEDIVGKVDYDFFPKELADKYRADDERIMKTGQTEELEEKYIQDGMDVWVNTIKTPVRDEKDNVIGVFGIFWDITERKRAVQILRESEEKLRLFVEQAPAPIAMLDENLNYLAVSSRWLSGHGWKERDLIGRNMYVEFPDIPERWKEIHRRCLAGAIESNEADPWMRSDGGTNWVRWEMGPWRKSDGSIGGLVVFSDDITENKRAEEALEISRERLLLAAEGAKLGIWNWDIVTGELIWSNQCKALFGIGLDETMSYQRFSDALYPDDRERTDIAVKDALDNHKDYDIEYRSLWPDGSIRWLAARGRGYYDATGKAVRMEGIVLDITERKRAEEALQASEEEFRTLAEAMPQIVWVTRSDGWNIYFNQQWTDYTGMTLEESYGHGWNKPFHPDDQQRAWDAWQNAVNNNGIYSIEARLRRFDGEYRWWLVRGVPLVDENGSIQKWFGTCTDIEEIKQAEAEIKKLNAELEQRVHDRTVLLEASNKEMEAFSYSVSHDLRAPLRHISGYVDLLNKRFREALPEKAGHYLNEITDSASQMGTLIDDLLQFSRTGRHELRQADMDMNAVVQEALEKLKPDMKNRKISWTVAELPRVFGDYSLLKQVWINLLENAVKYTQYKDEAKIEVGCTRADDQWAFFVRDNGVGFDMQYAHKLFGVFQRLHSPAQFEGTGIGLANVQRIIYKHGGRVRAEGRPDEGAAFYFTIPKNTFDDGGKS